MPSKRRNPSATNAAICLLSSNGWPWLQRPPRTSTSTSFSSTNSYLRNAVSCSAPGAAGSSAGTWITRQPSRIAATTDG